MASIKTEYGTPTAITVPSALNSLANGSSAALPEVDNSTDKFIDAIVEVTLRASGASNTGACIIYAIARMATSSTGSTWTDGLTVNGSVTTSDLDCAVAIGTVQMEASTNNDSTGHFSVAQAFGGRLPKYWTLVIRNESGAALQSTGNAVNYQGVYASST